ncbi:protein kinase domain-containing protein [Thermogemmatispora sp.]|uniref:protein kinase domain-containing protein n=1 Tax=Thermogemmatispora sp. TaxID=1968838 RepID=UPI001DCED935|nr:protein kinase [Thermogemmatispora sp.]MBX5451898.1 protein kinase [Thermogemmatispora sp.]
MYETQQEDLLVGQMVGGYRVEQLLSKGRVSAVYLARHPVSGVPVAVTAIIIPEDFSVRARNRFIRRFTQIATALLELDHPHILPIYDFGEQLGYPYLVSPYVTDGSVAHILKRDGRCAPSYALEVLQQVAAGLDYAHARGIVHRALKPANIVLQGDEHHVTVAGFGLVDLLQLRGVRRVEHPYLHLLNLAGTFLGAPEYLAPEVVLGQQQVDARADIYALGIILYEMLSGKPPFTGNDSLEIALQHVKQPVPALRNLCPSLPPEIDEVLSQALARDPARRFPSAGAFVAAYARALRREQSFAVAAPVASSAAQAQNQLAEDNELTSSGAHWQLRPPIITGHLPSVPGKRELPTTGPLAGSGGGSAWQDRPLPLLKEALTTGAAAGNGARREMVSLPGTLPQAVPPMPPAPPMPVPNGGGADLDSFAWWSGRPEDYAPQRAASGQATAAKAAAHSAEPAPVVLPAPREQREGQPGHSRQLPPVAPFAADIPVSTRRGRKRRRRQVVALLAGGGLAAAGLGLALKTSAAQSLLSGLFHAGQGPAATTTASTGQQPAAGQAGQSNAGSGAKSNGKVIGTTALALNSAQAFTNPADGKQGLLIHLPSGTFAAYSRSCTHEGVAVNYDPATHLLVCPAHGAIFDPAKKGSVVQGPATTPLPQIMIRVNADGSITTV